MNKITCLIPSFTGIVLLAFLILFFVSLPLFAKTKPVVCNEEDEWVNELPDQKKGKIYYFIGLTSGKKTVEEARQKAFSEAISVMSDVVGVTVNEHFSASTSTVQDQGAIAIEGATDDVININSLDFTIDNDVFTIDNFCQGRRNDGYNAAIKIAVAEEYIKRMNIEGKAKTAWQFTTSQCNDKQVKFLEKNFTDMASVFNWNLEIQRSNKNPDFSKKVPQTAYFVKVDVVCNARTEISLTRFNLIDRTLQTASGSNYKELKDIVKLWKTKGERYEE